MTKASVPSALEVVLDARGGFNTSWRRLFEALWKRTGQGYDIDIAPLSDTELQFSYRGSDGILRSGTLTLS